MNENDHGRDGHATYANSIGFNQLIHRSFCAKMIIKLCNGRQCINDVIFGMFPSLSPMSAIKAYPAPRLPSFVTVHDHESAGASTKNDQKIRTL